MLDLIGWLKKPFSFLIALLGSFFTPLFGLVSLITGAIANPRGAVNAFVCRIIDVVAFPFPSTPTNLKAIALVNSVGVLVPGVGSAIIYDFVQTFAAIFLIYVGVKIYKLIPFKMT